MAQIKKKNASISDSVIENKLNLDKIKWVHIRNLFFSYSVPENVFPKENSKVRFDFNIEKKVNPDIKMIKHVLTLKLTLDLGKNKDAQLEDRTEFVYLVENLEELIKKDKELINVNKVLDQKLSSLSYTTGRGILFQKTSNTIFAGFITPILNSFKVENESKGN